MQASTSSQIAVMSFNALTHWFQQLPTVCAYNFTMICAQFQANYRAKSGCRVSNSSRKDSVMMLACTKVTSSSSKLQRACVGQLHFILSWVKTKMETSAWFWQETTMHGFKTHPTHQIILHRSSILLSSKSACMLSWCHYCTDSHIRTMSK